MIRRIIAVALLVVLSLISSSTAFAGDSISGFSDADRELLRGDKHYYEGDFYRALTAYKNFLWEHPDDPRADHVRLKKAWVYYSAGEKRKAAGILDRLSQARADDTTGMWARHYLGQVAADADRYSVASRAFEGVIDLCRPFLQRTDQEIVDPDVEQCIELTGRARLALADVNAALHDFDAAADHLEQVPAQSEWAEQASEEADLVRGVTVPRKSPVLAGTLSIVPGLGHIYLGEVRNGLLAMAWNGIFIYGLVDSILSGNYGQAALIGLLETIWYSGTIFGAVSGAHRHNRDAKRIVEDGLRTNINQMTTDTPWPARFPTESPAYLELRLDF